MNLPIVVTGSQGFVGRHLRAALEARNREVIGVDLPKTGAEIELDLSTGTFDALELARRCGNVDGVIYLAATITRGSSVDARARRNLTAIATSALDAFEAFHETAPEAHFVYCSTYKIYGPMLGAIDPGVSEYRPDPHSYGCAKLLAERLLAATGERLGAAHAVVRPTCVYGPGQHLENAIPVFLSSAWAGRPPRVYGHGQQIRDDVFAPDVAYCLAEACLRRARGAFNAAGEGARALLDVAECCCRAVAAAGGPSGLHAVLDGSTPAKWWLDQRFDARRTQQELGFEPTPLQDGLLFEARWIQAGARSEEAVAFAPPPRRSAS